MIARCYNPNHYGYQNYGGRGIKVCDRWLESFDNFYDDMGSAPENHTLDRIDVDGDYTPDNCRWASHKEQHRNRRDNHWIAFDGQTKLLTEWALELGITPQALSRRLKTWSLERAMTEPSKLVQETRKQCVRGHENWYFYQCEGRTKRICRDCNRDKKRQQRLDNYG